MKSHQTASSIKELVDIIDVIRKLRNDLIKDFLDERNLILYLSEQFRKTELSASKAAGIKTDLKNLLISPVNIELYNSIIGDYKITGSPSVSKENEKLFYKDIDEILKNHVY
jgi:hypothetical protein